MSSRLPRYEALEKEDRIDELKKEKKQPTSPALLQTQQAPALPYAKVVGRPPRHWNLTSTIARHENGYSTSS